MSRVRSRVAWGIAIASIALGVVWAISTLALDQLSNEPHIVAVALASASGFAIIGALIASRTSNLVGWVMLAIAAAFGVFVATGAYTTYAIDILERPLPLHDEAALLATLAFFVSLMLIPAIAILFPTGRPRWPWLWHAYRVAFVVTLVGFAILPQTLTTFTETGVPSPFAIDAWRPVVGPILGVSTPAVMIAGFLGIASLVPRSRRSTEEERQQIRWFLDRGDRRDPAPRHPPDRRGGPPRRPLAGRRVRPRRVVDRVLHVDTGRDAARGSRSRCCDTGSTTSTS